MEPQGRVAVVTGASMGIGEAIAKVFVENRASVVLCSRDQKRAEEARQRFGRVDVWVNNAGYGLLDVVEEMPQKEFRQLFETNLFAAVDAMQMMIPVMKRQGGGTIINISSIAAHLVVPGMAAYCASKHALSAMSKGARMELEGSGVHVMTVCPGYIATDFAFNAVRGPNAVRMNRSNRGISPERVAQAVMRGYMKQSREIVVPWHDRIIINLYRHLPRMVEAFMRSRLRPAAEVLSDAARGKS
jgi:short-subunit dehydrogenase